ncbi:UDP-4-amino-4,6-dideoxy-N-acetyl-beta-L-altrosamine transaminase [Kordiimonas aestuarii]|uniref:UDP-4-amino-4, 6-dideoxy-N-acetyl-beta-L-altrosamine transaminase n=1 Tax=Kordiimonas aestuarii TaxID=1005925 RepID=UPI0021D366BF|nr:UDP-4-amino-4,6-dideoxy-N-acetyl-beta-L-altrosamine transaminase [Kordiimonas aestuarii]
MSEGFLPYGRHSIDEDDIAAVVDVLRHGALTCGPKVEEFEAAFAQAIGAKEAIVCSNGTTALHLAVIAAGVGPGDKVVVPAVTFLSTANVVRMAGADVIFADVDADTGLLTHETLAATARAAEGPIKAVMPVHLNGQCVEMLAVTDFARQHGARVITDCCHALGAAYHEGGHPGDGKYEDFACFSLHPVKSIAMGEGGFVTTNDGAAARRIRQLRGHDMERDSARWQLDAQGFAADGQPNPWYYEMRELAYNYRATDMQCALGLSQLKKLPAFVARRAQIADQYDTAFSKFSNSLRPVRRTKLASSAWHLYPVLIDFDGVGKDRAAVMRELQALGVGTQVHYLPVPWQPYYRDLYGDPDLPGAATYYGRVLSLPIYPAMTDGDVARVVSAVKSVLG